MICSQELGAARPPAASTLI